MPPGPSQMATRGRPATTWGSNSSGTSIAVSWGGISVSYGNVYVPLLARPLGRDESIGGWQIWECSIPNFAQYYVAHANIGRPSCLLSQACTGSRL
jgi:hypothetical protein